MDAPIGTYHMVPEAQLRDEVMCFEGFYDCEILRKKEAKYADLLDYYTRFLRADCPPSSSEWEWFDGTIVTKQGVMEVWDMLRQYVEVVRAAIHFQETEAGKRGMRIRTLGLTIERLEKELNADGPANAAPLRKALRSAEKEMNALLKIDKETDDYFWHTKMGPPGKEFMCYTEGAAWRKMMEDMGRTSASVLTRVPKFKG